MNLTEIDDDILKEEIVKTADRHGFYADVDDDTIYIGDDVVVRYAPQRQIVHCASTTKEFTRAYDDMLNYLEGVLVGLSTK